MTMHWMSPKLECRYTSVGHGVFATRIVEPGELLTLWGGEVATHDQLTTLSDHMRIHSLQVADDLYLVPHKDLESPDYFNHSCAPNAGLSGQIALVSLRPIQIDEEVTYDYAMSDSSAYDEFVCHCGTPQCRKVIRGSDWRLPELQRRYNGHFSSYLLRKMNRR